MATYKVVRMFLNGHNRTVASGLTLEEAQEWCRDPETSSKTAVSSVAKARTKRHGPWFDGFEKEK